MILPEAYAAVERVLAPFSVDEFFDKVLGRRILKVPGAQGFRTTMLGADPEKTILDAYGLVAPHLGSHAEKPLGPPPAATAVGGPREFRALIEAFHQRGYTVRVPSVRRFSPGVDAFCRALEMILHQPVAAEVFWSRGDAQAPTHHDDYDLIALQVRGSKRWFIDTDPSPLSNSWPAVPVATSPQLGPHAIVEVVPGDLLYIPRGTQHRVDALSDSIHLSIGFVPLTVREAVMAALDHLSDLDRTLRETAEGRLGLAIRRNAFGHLPAQVREGVAKLASACTSDAFVADALQRRSSRSVSGLTPLPRPNHKVPVRVDSRLRHTPGAMNHLSASASKIDFSHPGGHIYIHRGSIEAVAYISDTVEFCVRDLPGEITDDVRIALVDKLVAEGFLEVMS